jgi:hypothetical protein
MSANPPEKLNDFHIRLLEDLTLNPEQTLEELARKYKYTKSWLCTIINSDIFRAAMRARQEEIKEITHTDVHAHIRAAALRGLVRMTEKIEVADSLPELTNATKLALEGLGYVGKAKELESQRPPSPKLVVPITIYQEAKASFGLIATSEPLALENKNVQSNS